MEAAAATHYTFTKLIWNMHSVVAIHQQMATMANHKSFWVESRISFQDASVSFQQHHFFHFMPLQAMLQKNVICTTGKYLIAVDPNRATKTHLKNVLPILCETTFTRNHIGLQFDLSSENNFYCCYEYLQSEFKFSCNEHVVTGVS